MLYAKLCIDVLRLLRWHKCPNCQSDQLTWMTKYTRFHVQNVWCDSGERSSRLLSTNISVYCWMIYSILNYWSDSHKKKLLVWQICPIGSSETGFGGKYLGSSGAAPWGTPSMRVQNTASELPKNCLDLGARNARDFL